MAPKSDFHTWIVISFYVIIHQHILKYKFQLFIYFCPNGMQKQHSGAVRSAQLVRRPAGIIALYLRRELFILYFTPFQDAADGHDSQANKRALLQFP